MAGRIGLVVLDGGKYGGCIDEWMGRYKNLGTFLVTKMLSFDFNSNFCL